MQSSWLITGGAGNLACQLSWLLAERADRIVLFDIAERPVAAVPDCCTYRRGDITKREDIDRVVAECRPATILHLASMLSGNCEADRARGWAVNMDGGFGLFEAAIAHGVKRLFFLSTLAVYGGQLPDPLPEDTPQWPQGLYGVTKVALERLGVYYFHKCGLDFRCLRLPVIVSRYAPQGAASAYASHAFVESARTGAFTFRVRPQTAVSTMYVKDALQAMVGLLKAPADRLTRRVYNIHAIAPTAKQIADAITQRLPGVRLTFAPDPAVVALIESWPAVIEDGSARRDWGWQPAYDLDRLANDLIGELK